MTGDYVVAGRSMTPENREFLASPKAMVWIFFVAAQFAFWANVIEPLWRWRSQLRLDHGIRQTRHPLQAGGGRRLLRAARVLPGLHRAQLEPGTP